MPSQNLRNRMKYALAQGGAADELMSLLHFFRPFANAWYVSKSGNDTIHDGQSADKAFASVQKAHDSGAAGDAIFIAPGEYDEDVIVTKAQLSLYGCGPRHSVRITGTSAGTATAMHINAVDEVGIYNLNCEARSGGDGLLITGPVRRLEIVGNKLHGGTNAIKTSSTGSQTQIVDIRIEDNVIANATNGLNVVFTAGPDPNHQILVRGNLFQKLVTAGILSNGDCRDWTIDSNIFAANSGTETTTYLDIDDSGSTGIVSRNMFHTSEWDTTAVKIASGIFVVGNQCEAEGVGGAPSGSSGRPD